MPVSLLKWYRRLDLNLSEGLGMTEDFAYSHIAKGKDALPGSVGLPRLGVERRIAPDGELLLRSPGAFVGYHKRPDLDAEAFTEDGFFRTGDLAVIVPSGELRLTGRKQETFKTAKGKFVAPAPIEALIEESPLVELSLVTGAGLPAAYAVVAPVEDYRIRLDEPDLRKAFETEMRAVLTRVNEQLADHEYLSKIVVSRAMDD
jgi:long-chain acyl-CoA synthetase